jgi:hypothetical protein
MAAATQRGEAVALIDPLDQFDPPSAAAAGLDLSRLLWVRGAALAAPVQGRVSVVREWGEGHVAVERAVKAVSLVFQAGNFGVVALDLAEVPAAVVRRLPFTTWLRLQRGSKEATRWACSPRPRRRRAARMARRRAAGAVGSRQSAVASRQSACVTRHRCARDSAATHVLKPKLNS